MTGTTTRTATTTSGWCEAESAPDDLFCLERVYRAYRACRRRKRGAREVQRYEMALLDRLVETTDDLAARRWRPSRSVCFAVSRPKAREIHAAAFADRVVHHLLVPELETYFEPIFIHDLYSNRTGKGTHAAVRRLAHFMRRAMANGERPAWFLQLDVRNFFNSIDHAILKGLLRRRLDRARADPGRRASLLWLAGQVIDGAQQVVYGGDPRLLARVPPYKRLAEAGPGRGLPIGNLTSQFFANVYLNELDQFVKHRLKAPFYVRYVDDLVLVHQDPAQLQAWGDEISGFLAQRLGLVLKTPWGPRPVEDGADFLGYIVRPWYRLVRRRVLGHLEERLGRAQAALVASVSAERGLGGRGLARASGQAKPRGLARPRPRPRGGPVGAGLVDAGLPALSLPGAGRGWLLDLPAAEREALRATVASYLGHFRHAHAKRLGERLLRHWPWLKDLFDLEPGPRAVQRWQPRGVASLRGQWRALRRRFHPARLLIQVGRSWELHAGDHEGLPGRLLHRGRSSVRPGMGEGWSFPWSDGERIEAHWRRRGQAYALVAEEGRLARGLKRRCLRRLFRPVAGAAERGRARAHGAGLVGAGLPALEAAARQSAAKAAPTGIDR